MARKRKKHLCLNCQQEIFNRQSNAKWCLECLPEIRKQQKKIATQKESIKRRFEKIELQNDK